MKKIMLFIWAVAFQMLLAQPDVAFNAFKNNKALKGATIGFNVLDIKTGNTVFSFNDQSFLYPASIQKTITTAAALHLLGSDFNYITKVSYSGEISNGILNGVLIIKAAGDPSCNSNSIYNDFYVKLLNLLKNNGINKINGRVELTSSSPETVQTWLYEDIGNYYGVSPQLFNYKDNQYTIFFRQKAEGESPIIEKIENKVPYNFDLQLTCSNSHRGDNSFILGAPFSLERQIVGTISAGTGLFKVKGANSYPSYTFLEDLKSAGIYSETNNMANGNEISLGEIVSPKLKDIVKTTNFESNNLFAEAILNTLGLEFKGQYDTEAGLDVLNNYINQLNLSADAPILKDGCGLSRLNAMTARFESEFLCSNYTNKDFVNSLPKAGIEGTLQYLTDEQIKGKIQAKSGSSSGVINYAGYITKNNGEVLSFSLILNNAYGSKVAIRREIGLLLAQFL